MADYVKISSNPVDRAHTEQTTRLVDGVSYTLAYDEENRIETVTLWLVQANTAASQTWTFHYDGNGTRVRQVNPDGSQLLLLNGGRYHAEIAADSSESTTRYYGTCPCRLRRRQRGRRAAPSHAQQRWFH